MEKDKNALDIRALLEVTEELVSSGKIEMAEEGRTKVQDIVIGEHEFEIFVLIKRKYK